MTFGSLCACPLLVVVCFVLCFLIGMCVGALRDLFKVYGVGQLTGNLAKQTDGQTQTQKETDERPFAIPFVGSCGFFRTDYILASEVCFCVPFLLLLSVNTYTTITQASLRQLQCLGCGVLESVNTEHRPLVSVFRVRADTDSALSPHLEPLSPLSPDSAPFDERDREREYREKEEKREREKKKETHGRDRKPSSAEKDKTPSSRSSQAQTQIPPLSLGSSVFAPQKPQTERPKSSDSQRERDILDDLEETQKGKRNSTSQTSADRERDRERERGQTSADRERDRDRRRQMKTAGQAVLGVKRDSATGDALAMSLASLSVSSGTSSTSSKNGTQSGSSGRDRAQSGADTAHISVSFVSSPHVTPQSSPTHAPT